MSIHTTDPVGDAALSDEAAPEAGAPDRRAGFVHRWNRSLAGLAAVAIALLGYHVRWICDDALIFTRTVEQVLAGNGPVYSAGERAEASTSTLWQWLLALTGFVSGRSDTSGIAWILGLALTTAGFLIAVDATRRLYAHTRSATPATLAHDGERRTERPLLPFGILILLALRPVWEYATSGLETGLGTLWAACAWWLLVRLRDHRSRPLVLGTSTLVGLGPMVRPDLALVSGVFLVAMWLLVRPSWRTTTAAVAAAGAIPVAYEVFRMGYYGVVVPMPALTKDAGGSMWGRGWGYVTDFTGPYLLWLPLAAAAIGLALTFRGGGAHRDQRIVALTPPAAAALLFLYVTRVGGDYMHARMLLPALFLLVLPVLAIPLSRTVVPLSVGLLVWSLVCAASMRVDTARNGVGARTDDERAYYVVFTDASHPTDSGDYVRTHRRTQQALAEEIAAGRRTLVYYGPGLEETIVKVPLRDDVPGRGAVIGVYLGTAGMLAPDDVRVVDFWGLVNPIGARLEHPVTKPGHSKPLSNVWLLADYADPAAPLNTSRSFAETHDATIEQVEAARRALECGDLTELRESTREPMTAGRFWKNLTGSWHRTHITIPPNPIDAEREFCAPKGR